MTAMVAGYSARLALTRKDIHEKRPTLLKDRAKRPASGQFQVISAISLIPPTKPAGTVLQGGWESQFYKADGFSTGTFCTRLPL